MRDSRPRRKRKVLPFIDAVGIDRANNLAALVDLAKMLKLEGFEDVKWDDSVWSIKGGRLMKLTGKNVKSASLSFCYPPELGGGELNDEWGDFAKSIVVLRLHRKNQCLTNQQEIISSIGYIADAASNFGCDLSRVTHEILDAACKKISDKFAKSTGYNRHKNVSEIAGYFDANALCRIYLKYKYSAQQRPDNVNEVGHKRLDDPRVLETKGDKLIEPKVFKVIAELHSNVPKDHKYRVYVLILVLLACLGRRFSEIAELPFQKNVQRDDAGCSYIEYFPCKKSRGDLFTPKEKLYMLTEVVPIVELVIDELNEICGVARDVATEMQRSQGPDLRFLNNIHPERRLYVSDIRGFGIPRQALSSVNWFRRNNLAFADVLGEIVNGCVVKRRQIYTFAKGIIEYCKKDYSEAFVKPIHIDQFSNTYYLKDLLIVRLLGSSSGHYMKWLATKCTHSMMTTFLRYFPDLAATYATSAIEVDFTSHEFRHTINTLLDEGGLTDLLQTEWFGRSNPKDTKRYQHTSREKRALMVREDLLKGKMRGAFADVVMAMPVTIREALVEVRIKAIHDVGVGVCFHNFSQLPCPRHLQCSAECDHLLTSESDEDRKVEQMRQLAITTIARDTAESFSKTARPKKSVDWMTHNEKKIKMLKAELEAGGVVDFDPRKYFEELIQQKAMR